MRAPSGRLKLGTVLRGEREGIGQQLNGVAMRSAPSAALQRADGVATYAGSLGKLRLGQARFDSVAPQQRAKR
jgi:hypothetical protein